MSEEHRPRLTVQVYSNPPLAIAPDLTPNTSTPPAFKIKRQFKRQSTTVTLADQVLCTQDMGKEGSLYSGHGKGFAST
jgi:hypothetical protein